jgi:ATP synthase protein I
MSADPGRPPRSPADPPRGSEPVRDPRTEGRHKIGTSGMAYAGLGMQFVVALLLFLYLGQWADRKLGTAPWMLLLGVFVGAGGAFYSMYRRLTRDQAAEDEARRREREARGP